MIFVPRIKFDYTNGFKFAQTKYDFLLCLLLGREYVFVIIFCTSTCENPRFFPLNFLMKIVAMVTKALINFE